MPTEAPSGGGHCFPAEAVVKLKNGKSITMSEVRTGDQVQTSTNGPFTYFLS